MKNFLLENEDLVVGASDALAGAGGGAGGVAGLAAVLTRAERLYFVGQDFTINLIPQAVVVVGWLALVSIDN